MKKTLALALIFFTLNVFGQDHSANTFNISYFGEMITHPGFRMSIDVPVRVWGEKKDKQIIISPSVGAFTHKRYQSAYFLLPDFSIRIITEGRNSYSAGFGFGFQKSSIPDTYYYTNSQAFKIEAYHWYLLSSFFIEIERKKEREKNTPLYYYIKPNLIFAYPNFPSNVGYFALEVGVKYELAK